MVDALGARVDMVDALGARVDMVDALGARVDMVDALGARVDCSQLGSHGASRSSPIRARRPAP